MNLAQYIHSKLGETGVTYAFGVPGAFVMPVWQEFEVAPKVVLARHESGSVFMADGYARATGTIGVVLATTGAGLTNCVTGVASAYRDSIPMLVVTGQAPTASFGRGSFLESYIFDRSFSPAALFAPITKKSIEIADLRNARFLVDYAIALATCGRPGPVHLSVPVDLQPGELSNLPSWRPTAPSTRRIPRFVPCPAGELRDAATAFADAERPLIIAGWGTYLADAGRSVMQLAEATGAIVVSTAKAIACFAQSDELWLGHVGPGQRPDIVDNLAAYEPDLVLVCGASLSQYYAGQLSEVIREAMTLRIDIDGDQIPLRAQADYRLVGDARKSVELLVGLLAHDQPVDQLPEARLWVRRFRDKAEAARRRQPLEFEGKPSMSGSILALCRLLPEDAIVLPDAGNHWLDTLSLLEPKLPGGLQLNCGLGPMGWAIGASVGMAFVEGAPKIICVTGDGSMLMHGTELSVAVEHGLDLLTVVFNNKSHARVRLGQRQDYGGRFLSTDIPEIDFAGWAEAMGMVAKKVTRAEDVESALRAAVDTRGPALVEIDCDSDEVPAALRNWVAHP